jgi:hypothetical protein
MKYAVEMGSDAMMYIPSFIKSALAIQKLIGWDNRHTDIPHKLTLFFQNKEGSLKKKYLLLYAFLMGKTMGKEADFES